MAHTTVYLIRHAHAEWSEDDARPLSAAGARAARTVARLLEAQPIAAIYSSPLRRSIDTVAPLAERLGRRLELVADLRERELPLVAAGGFDAAIAAAWRAPDEAPHGGEPNAVAQARGAAALRDIVARHPGEHVVVATHGNLLALIMRGLGMAVGYEFWQRLSCPDIYRLEIAAGNVLSAARIWSEPVSAKPGIEPEHQPSSGNPEV